MRCKNCGWDNPEGIHKCEKCGTRLQESSQNYKKCLYGHYYQGDHCPYCKEKEKLKSQLEDLRKDPPSFPPSQNAMCYCQAPPDWHGENDNDDGDSGKGGNGTIHKVLIIIAVVVAIAIGVAIALV